MKATGEKLKDLAKRQIYMLTVIFLAGMAINILGMPSDTTRAAMAVSVTLTLLYVLIGAGLIIGGIRLILLANKAQKYTALT